MISTAQSYRMCRCLDYTPIGSFKGGSRIEIILTQAKLLLNTCSTKEFHRFLSSFQLSQSAGLQVYQK